MHKAERLDTRNLFLEGATAEAPLVIAVGAGTAGLVFWKALNASPAMTVLAALGGAMLVGAGIYAMARRAAIRRIEPETDEHAISLDGGPELLGIAEVVSYLQTHLGLEVTAFLSGVDDTSAVVRWSSGEARPEPLAEERLRFGYEVTRPIVRAYDGKTACVWLFGTNEWLEDEAPVEVLREGRRPEDWAPVVEAAEGFVEFVP